MSTKRPYKWNEADLSLHKSCAATDPFLETAISGAREIAQKLRVLVLAGKAWVSFPVPTRQLTTVRNSNSRGIFQPQAHLHAGQRGEKACEYEKGLERWLSD